MRINLRETTASISTQIQHQTQTKFTLAVLSSSALYGYTSNIHKLKVQHVLYTGKTTKFNIKRQIVERWAHVHNTVKPGSLSEQSNITLTVPSVACGQATCWIDDSCF